MQCDGDRSSSAAIPFGINGASAVQYSATVNDGELAAQDARIQTLLAFVPERDVAMVFDGAATGPGP